MGQAQLLLIVLGVVLVGIAIVAGIQAYDANNRKASVDALTHDAFRIGSDWQLWAQKPEQFGGPDADLATAIEKLQALTAAATLGYTSANGLVITNTNGTCTLDPGVNPVTVTCENDNLNTMVEVSLTGVAEDEINVTDSEIDDGISTTG